MLRSLPHGCQTQKSTVCPHNLSPILEFLAGCSFVLQLLWIGSWTTSASALDGFQQKKASGLCFGNGLRSQQQKPCRWRRSFCSSGGLGTPQGLRRIDKQISNGHGRQVLSILQLLIFLVLIGKPVLRVVAPGLVVRACTPVCALRSLSCIPIVLSRRSSHLSSPARAIFGSPAVTGSRSGIKVVLRSEAITAVGLRCARVAARECKCIIIIIVMIRIIIIGIMAIKEDVVDAHLYLSFVGTRASIAVVAAVAVGTQASMAVAVAVVAVAVAVAVAVCGWFSWLVLADGVSDFLAESGVDGREAEAVAAGASLVVYAVRIVNIVMASRPVGCASY
mmetsp:Transcript_60140/g.108257  ORF Transcript_60140/g.108257 Transcript_60140/m.108257 type:complete len:335 (-) Transcript_60140:698-1702(-)